ncbi:MAG: FHA domain-containing protein, partial [Planctomycetes bacterium]|nr:FHA domain-containing protein [Planctomycetota bacterium]
MDESGRPVQEYRVENDISVGRYEENTLQFDDQIISGEHCVFSRDGGAVTVTDLDSSNGTWVNQERIKGTRVLQHGDVITLALVARFAFGDPNAVSKAGGQTLPQMKRHVAMSLPTVPAPSWGPSMVVALLVFAIAAGGGFFLPQVLFKAPTEQVRSEANKTSPAMSFEEGTNGGWSLRARGGAAKIGVDSIEAFDGKQSIVISIDERAKATLESQSAIPFNIDAFGELSFQARGTISNSLAVTAFALIDGQRRLLGSNRSLSLSQGAWSEIKIPLQTPTPIANAVLALEFNGGAKALWMDHLAIRKTESGSAGTNDESGGATHGVMLQMEEGRLLSATNPSTGVQAKLLPVVLNAERVTLEGEWTESQREATIGGRWLLQSGENRVQVGLTHEETARVGPRFKPGQRLVWETDAGRMVALSVQLKLAGETLSLYDVYGNEVAVNAAPAEGLGNVFAIGTSSLLFIFEGANMGVKFSKVTSGQDAEFVVTNMLAVPPQQLAVLVMASSPFRQAL